MNPMLLDALGSIVRWVLAFGAGWLVQHGIWTQANATIYVTAFAAALIALGWSLWQKYRSRVKLLAVLNLVRGLSEQRVENRLQAKTIAVPPVSTPKNVIPTMAPSISPVSPPDKPAA